MDFNQALKTIWLIEVTDPNGYACWGPNHVTYFTGVCVDNNRILTCANGFTDTCTVSGRRLHKAGFIELETVHVRQNMGLRLLKCKKDPVLDGDFECGKFSDDEILNCFDEVSQIDYRGSSYFGYVSYPCKEVINPLSFLDSRLCKDYRSENVLRPYRTIGNFVNVGTLLEGDIEDNDFNQKLHPNVPVLQCAGYFSVETRSLGGPLYRENGDIMGIVTHIYEGFYMAVHVSAVKAFLDEAKRNDEKVGVDRFEESMKRLSSPTPPLSLTQTMDYEKINKTIWVIQITPHSRRVFGPSISYLTGVSVDKNIILTCSHGITDKCTVLGRRLHESEFIHELETVQVGQKLGLKLFKCKSEPVGEFPCGKISDDEKLNYSDKVFHVGNPRGLSASYFSGYASYPCVKVDPSTFSDTLMCQNHVLSKDSMFLKSSLPYRTMGVFVNVRTLSEGDIEDTEVNRNLHPKVPVVHCGGFHMVAGCFGGPLYRENGEILGILTHYFKGMAMAVHASALKAFLDEAISHDEKVGEKRFKESTPCSSKKKSGWVRDDNQCNTSQIHKNLMQ